MKKILMIVVSLLATTIFLTSCDTEKSYLNKQDPGLYASIFMDSGDIIFAKLAYKDAPLTVTNFAGLASGKFSDHIERKGNFFDGLTIHRVEPDFVIQGGDPSGNGQGGPGYQFSDEFSDNLKHDSAGVLSMANAGPNTNGSQFFITMTEAPFLDGRHSVFGKVVEGLDIVKNVAVGAKIKKITIFPKGDEAQTFFDNINYEQFIADSNTKIEEQKKVAFLKKESTIHELKTNSDLSETPEGIFYKILKSGSGRTNKNNDEIETHYILKVYGEEKVIDDSYQRKQPFALTIGARQVIPGWEIILTYLKVGDKARVIIPPELAYGESGAGNGVIPPNAFLDFTIEVVNRK